MEIKYVLLTIIKILISVPTIFLFLMQVEMGTCAAMMGGHLDNKNLTMNFTESTDINQTVSTEETTTEEVPDPSALVLPGYNLPENIFNKGKPFYLEKDPLTGQIDFDSKTASLRVDDDLYDYIEDEPSSNIYDKANIDRKDGSLASHKPSDVNQLTPNFHDFLNLPVKYNSDKYVYPLISSSYANTKIQGNVNKYHNHKDYNLKTSTNKPTVSPTYFNANSYYAKQKTSNAPQTTTTTTTTARTTPKTTTEVYLTTKTPNLLQSPMNHPSFHEDFEDYYEPTTKKQQPNNVYLTTNKYDNIYLTTKGVTTTTKRPMSLFEQLFGDYDETVTTTEKTRPPALFQNLPVNKNKNKIEASETKTEKVSFAASTTLPPHVMHHPNSHAGPSSASYEYEDYSQEETGSSSTTKAPEKSTVTTSTTTTTPSSSEELYDEDYDVASTTLKNVKFAATTTTTESPTTSAKVTSLPLGENHVTSLNNRQPIIVATQNIRQQLNNEKVMPKPFGFEKQPPSTSNIHIAPDQDTVSFVVGHHQNVDGGQYVGTSLKESPYDSNPFRPLYGQQAQYSKDTVSYTIQSGPEVFKAPPPPPAAGPATSLGGSSITIQPQKNSEASLAIGVPVQVQQVPGQVMDEKLELEKEKIEFPASSTSNKIVFPDEKEQPNLPPAHIQPSANREVLKLNSKPMYHQLPSDLTPPKEKEVGQQVQNLPTQHQIPPLHPPPPALRKDRPRPPWDPRPGHFYSGKPEYARPPRPHNDIQYKRIDNLPNILPQFRPNMKNNAPPSPPHHYMRQPLLERPSNRPIGFFEKLQPPPPPKNLHNLRKIPPPPSVAQQLEHYNGPIAEDRIINEAPSKHQQLQQLHQDNQFQFYPPKVVLATRRIGNLEGDVETLQMIQAKKSEKKDILDVDEQQKDVLTISSNNSGGGGTDKPLYVVYPVNTPPIKLDLPDSNKKESVVIGTRAELPLPPSKINNFDYEQNPILNPKDRNDAPVLKPHPRPTSTFPIKSDFPYPLERPDPSVLTAVPEAPASNTLDDNLDFHLATSSNNQWNTIGESIESRIVNNKQNGGTNQISVTLKTYTEKPIAVAYTPTEPHSSDRYSMPNYGSPVIPEIRPGTVDNAEVGSKPDNEFTVSAVMHTHPQLEKSKPQHHHQEDISVISHKSDTDSPSIHQLDFQAPFQASVSVDSVSQGWSVVRDKAKATTQPSPDEATTLPLATTSEFDIENFKPQLIGGFKPIYSYPSAVAAEDGTNKAKDSSVSEREE